MINPDFQKVPGEYQKNPKFFGSQLIGYYIVVTLQMVGGNLERISSWMLSMCSLNSETVVTG